ncbi:MAG: transaldolase [Candidatus Dormibacteraeota bacterium]|nr:transaldolase [Candidatus Dormibacteraeota bacterium]
MSDSPLLQLQAAGQSVWLDNISRGVIDSGGLQKLVDRGVTGVTSNPTIFAKAIGGSKDYDGAIQELRSTGKDADAVAWELILRDIRDGADVLKPVFDRTNKSDGFISIEVSPKLADDTEGTVAMVQDLHRRAGKENVLVKIPATKAGLPAIRRSIAAGINVNVTLIFSVERYDEVVDAYLSGLEDLQAQNGDLGKVASVASFFVSRVDSKVDKLLGAVQGSQAEQAKALQGKIAIANSKEAYAHWKRLFSGERWAKLEAAGAKKQRCLWASTSTKNPDYPDTYYVTELIGPDTVNTMPGATIDAFEDHGVVRRTLDADLETAQAQMAALPGLGIDMAQVTYELEREGVQAFDDSFDELLATVAEQVAAVAG